MDDASSTAQLKEHVRHVSEIAFDNPVYEREEKPIINVYREDVNFDLSMVPPSIKFLDKTKTKKKLCYVCVVWLMLVCLASLVIVLVAFSTQSNKDRPKSKPTTQSQRLEGQFRIVNMEFDAVYADVRSKQYRALTAQILTLLDNIAKKTVIYSELNETMIQSLSPGSIEVVFVMTFLSTYESGYLHSVVTEAFSEQTTVVYIDSTWYTYLGPYRIADDWLIRALPKEEEHQLNNKYTTRGCERITSPICVSDNEVPYTSTILPNYIDHQTVLIANMYLDRVSAIIDSGCYAHARMFLCSIVLPRCEDGNRMPPCRAMCQDFFRRCRSQIPDSLHFINCDDFPRTQCTQAPGMDTIDIQLTGAGVLALHIGGDYKHVCGRGWSDVDGHVVCQQINRFLVQTWTESPTEDINLSNWVMLNCIGNEKLVSQCEIMSTTIPCNEVAMIQCSNAPDTPAMKVRLNGAPDSSQGRLEVYYSDQWGTVCDDKFNMQAARVVCRMLGYRNASNIQLVKSDRFPVSNDNDPIWLDNVMCRGNETMLSECSHNNWGDHNCIHTEDVALLCNTSVDEGEVRLQVDTSTTLSPEMPHTTPVIDVRLRDGPDGDRGRVEVMFNATWGTVCNVLFTDATASVFCRHLGFSGGRYEFTRYGAGVGPIWLTEVICQGHEQSFQQCVYNMHDTQDCTHIDDASISCA